MVTPAGVGVSLLYVTVVMLVLSWVVFTARTGIRMWIKAFGVDDWLMGAGLILYSITAALVIVCCFYGAGQHSNALTKPAIMQGTKLFFIAEFFYASSTVPIKCSICATLLRIADARRRFVWTLWGLMVLVAVAAVIFIVTIANICHPISTLWGEATGTCNPSLNSSVGFFFSAIAIATDWTLAILPAALLWNVQMKRRVKLSVALILALAAFASCATIIRLRYLTLYDDQAEFMFGIGAIGLWSVIEEGIGIIAGSMPALGPLLSCSSRRRTAASGSDQPSAGTPFHSLSNQGHDSHRKRRRDDVKLATFDSTTLSEAPHNRNESHTSDTDGDSQKHILKETQVTVTAEDYNAADDWARQRVLGWEKRNY
ncbi:hypothetical protein DL762_003746 [Monosporascus cannonballus]|uniref:Rhodopsin domain-containing protein n=1 Tax=Monosporascus cannonballus TaxID=155416 RepID=A0ABY0HAY7_9PEZI|nr:hypothetical protein DL762_003746 [Monosporascus cannonballus]